jgi:hypothetical protein
LFKALLDKALDISGHASPQKYFYDPLDNKDMAAFNLVKRFTKAGRSNPLFDELSARHA